MEWISVKDRLPDSDDSVLILIEVIEIYGKHKEKKTMHHDIFLGYCDSGRWITSYCYGCEYIEKAAKQFPNEILTVTHWMPLPEPPKID